MQRNIFLAFTALVTSSSATISLNISGPDWDYTTANLKPSTSLACKAAYSAPIDCSPTLLGLAASMRPSFKPAAPDLDATCTPHCSAALAAYVHGVAAACTLPNDAALDLVNATKPYEYADQPVELVGQLLQYTLASNCRTAPNGMYCYTSGSAYADTDFACDDACYISFFQIAHDHPASRSWFNYYELLPRSDYWNETFTEGYARLQHCGKATAPLQERIAAAFAAREGAEGAYSALLNEMAGTLP